MPQNTQATNIKSAPKELRVSDQLFRTMIECANDMIWTLDATGNFTFFNHRAEIISGYNLNEWIGKSFAPLIHPDDLPAVTRVFARVMAGASVQYTVRFYNKQKNIVFLSVNTAPIREAGKIIGTFSFGRDITEEKRGEKKLRESEERLKTFFEISWEGIVIHDKGTIIDLNSRLAKMFGYTYSEMIGMDGIKLVAPEHRELLLKNAATNYKKPYEITCIRKNGAKFPVEIVGRSIFYQGRMVRVGSIADVTERKRSEQIIITEKNKADAVLASISDAVFTCDKNGTIFLFNKAAEKLTGLSAKKVIGRHYRDVVNFVKESNGKPVKDFIAKAITDDKITKMSNHALLIRSDGLRIPVADAAAPIKRLSGEIIGCVIVFRDVTYEREIDKSKTEFISLASHQLRTPLSIIRWYCEILMTEDMETLNTKQKKYLKEIYHGGLRMSVMVNSLLNVSRLELGTFSINPEETNIRTLTHKIIGELMPKMRQKKQSLTETYARNVQKIRVDQNLLRIVLQNLLSNAIDYTPRNGKISFNIKTAVAGDMLGGKKIDTACLVFIVADSGYGIPKNQQGMIFKKFFRADNIRKKNIDGTGLGLYITKSIIEQIGGYIWFKSPSDIRIKTVGKKKRGTEFYVALPLVGIKKRGGVKILV